MNVFKELFTEFPRASIKISHSELGTWTQVDIPGLPSMQYTPNSPNKKIKVYTSQYADLNKDPLEVIAEIIKLAKADREDPTRGR